MSLEDAQKDFEKKFQDKTKNSWAERDHFVAHPSKYTLIEVQREDEAQEAMVKVKWPEREGGPGPREGTATAQLYTLRHRPSSLALVWPGPALGAGALPSCSCPGGPSTPR